MLTERGKVLLVVGVFVWLASRTFGVDAFAMVGVSCLVLVGAAAVYTRVMSADLRAKRVLRPARLFHDALGRVDLDVTNSGRLQTAMLVVEDHVPTSLAEPPRIVTDPIHPGQTVRLSYPTRGRRRGRYRIGPARLLLRDPFGLAQRSVEVGATSELVVYPPVLVLPPALPQAGRFGASSQGQNRPPTPYGEFATVREYVHGDDLRKVHWKSTAHRGELMVTQDEAPREAQATIILDTRGGAHRGLGDSSTFERAVTVTASAAYHLDERAYSLRLLTRPVVGVPVPRGWRAVLDELAGIEMTGSDASLRPLWGQLASGIGGDGLLVAVLAPPTADDLRDMIRAGRRFGARTAVIVAPAESQDEADAAVRALRIAGWRATAHLLGGQLAEDWSALSVRPSVAASASAALGSAS